MGEGAEAARSFPRPAPTPLAGFTCWQEHGRTPPLGASDASGLLLSIGTKSLAIFCDWALLKVTFCLAQTVMQLAMRTQVAIIGGGPSGLLLSHILDRNGIDSIVLERQSRQHVLLRIRAGVLEAGTVDLLRAIGLGERMDREGHPHDGSAIAWEGRDRFFIDTKKFTGKSMMAYGQTAITEDLYAARDAAGGQIIDEADNVQLHELTSPRPYVTYEKHGQNQRIDCDYVAGCDGYHGVSRQSIPASVLRTYEKGYPFGWLGIMSQTPPFPDLCYCYHRRGFALASMRSPMLSRYYIQCDLDTRLEDWPDERVAEIVDQAGEASAGDWTTPNPPGPSKKVGGSGPPLQVLQPFEGLNVK